MSYAQFLEMIVVSQSSTGYKVFSSIDGHVVFEKPGGPPYGRLETGYSTEEDFLRTLYIKHNEHKTIS